VLQVLDLFGVFVFAISGAAVAARKQLDLFGALVLATVTALGGGTLRDVLLDRHPLGWFGDATPLLAVLAAVLLSVLWCRWRPLPRHALAVADAIGLGVFCVVGTRIALEAGQSGVIAVILGVMSGACGGLIRDVLCAEVPMVLRQDVYATAAAAGCTLLLAMDRLAVAPGIGLLAGGGLIVVLRLGAIFCDWHLPRFVLRGEDD